MHLLSKDFSILEKKANIIDTEKYFCNIHVAASTLTKGEGIKPTFPRYALEFSIALFWVLYQKPPWEIGPFLPPGIPMWERITREEGGWEKEMAKAVWQQCLWLWRLRIAKGSARSALFSPKNWALLGCSGEQPITCDLPVASVIWSNPGT